MTRRGRPAGGLAVVAGLAPSALVSATLIAAAVAAAAVSSSAAAPAATSQVAGDRSRADGPRVTVQRRGGLDDLDGTLRSLDHRGIEIASTRLGVRLLTWDRVRGVAGTSDPYLASFLEEGATIWRARIRISRGDPLSAEPLLESVAERFAGRTSELALVVAEGLLRCRIARGANDEAVIPMLETLRLRAAGVSADAYLGLRPVIDEALQLVPAVPPAWHAAADRGGLQARLERRLLDLQAEALSEPTEVRRAAAARTANVARAYLAAVVQERGRAGGRPDVVPLPVPGDDEGLRLLVECVGGAEALAALDPPDDGRPPDPTEILESASGDDRPAWVRDWEDFFRGRRALAAPDAATRDAGLIDLLRPAALHAVERPYLGGMALALAAAHLDRAGRAAEATILRDDLAARFRGHPDVTAGDRAGTETPDP
jgi:hypothetical protein